VRVERVIGLGGAFRMPQIREYVGKMLGQDVEIPKSVSKFTAAPGLDAGWLNDEVGTMAVALGLAVQGLGLARTDINLLPEEVLREQMIKRKKPWAVLAALAVILAVGFAYFVQNEIIEAYDAYIERGRVLDDRIASLKKEYTAENSKLKPLETRLKAYSRIGRERPWFVDCLVKLNGVLLNVDPRGSLLAERQPSIYIKQVYMSRYPEEASRLPLEDDPGELASEDGTPLSTPSVGPSGPGYVAPPPPRRPGAPGAEEAKVQPDKPMMVVLFAEIRGERGQAEAPIEPAFNLREALKDVENFERPDLMGGWTPYLKIDMPRDRYLAELDKKRKGEPYKIVTRPFKMFKMAWRYDDGSDLREEHLQPGKK